MPRIDLNIVDRGAEGTRWTAEDIALTADSLDKVVEQKTDNCAALNSLPTPFARFFVAREAFRRVMEENLDQTKEAGLAYTQMVSDILDVYELLFNLKYHKKKVIFRQIHMKNFINAKVYVVNIEIRNMLIFLIIMKLLNK